MNINLKLFCVYLLFVLGNKIYNVYSHLLNVFDLNEKLKLGYKNSWIAF